MDIKFNKIELNTNPFTTFCQLLELTSFQLYLQLIALSFSLLTTTLATGATLVINAGCEDLCRTRYYFVFLQDRRDTIKYGNCCERSTARGPRGPDYLSLSLRACRQPFIGYIPVSRGLISLPLPSRSQILERPHHAHLSLVSRFIRGSPGPIEGTTTGNKPPFSVAQKRKQITPQSSRPPSPRFLASSFLHDVNSSSDYLFSNRKIVSLSW